MGLAKQVGDRLLVLYDGPCGFCNWAVCWLLRRDHARKLCFAPNTHPDALPVLTRHWLVPSGPQDEPGTVVVISGVGTDQEQVLLRSQAVLACMAQLSAPWPLLARWAGFIPLSWRDALYRLVARWRYRVWKGPKVCSVLPPEQKQHFLA